jgi:hypothetical protein
MIPYTFPSDPDHGTRQCVVFPLTSVTGLTAWVDYTPVKKVTGYTRNSYNNTGGQFVTEIPDTTGLQAFLDYIPVYYDNSLTIPWSTDAGGYIPVMTDAYGYNMTSAGDYFSTPDSAATSITGDITLIVEAALTDWTPGTINVLVSKDGVTLNRSYSLTVQTNGTIRFNYSLLGLSVISITSSVAPSFVNGKKYHVAVERESSTGKVRFYTSKNGRDFTQLGTEQTGTAGAIYDGTAQVEFGNLSALSYALVGSIYDSEGYAGLAITDPVNAVMKYDFDPADWTSGTAFTSKETGEVWTLNGNAAIYK